MPRRSGADRKRKAGDKVDVMGDLASDYTNGAGIDWQGRRRDSESRNDATKNLPEHNRITGVHVHGVPT